MSDVLTAFSHVGDACCVHLTPSQLRIVCNPEHSATDGVYAFFQCAVSSVLESCKVESRAAGNDILFLVSIAGMLKAVRSCESFDSRVIKLSKKDGRAYLSFDMHSAIGDPYQPSQLTASAASPSSSSLMSLTQDVPILVLPASALPSTAEPDLSLPSIRLQFPPLRPFHTAIDRLRSISPTLTLRLSNAGSMVVSGSDDISSMQTHWKGLALDAAGGGEEQCTVRVRREEAVGRAALQGAQPADGHLLRGGE